MKKKIWDFWAKNYSKLWVQKYSLGPTRTTVKNIISSYLSIEESAAMSVAESASISLLDIGCGTGELLSDLKDFKKLQMSGLDFSKGMVEESKRKNKNVTHHILDVQEIDKIDKKYSIITCTHSLPYYSSKRSILEKIHSILKDDGLAIFAFASGNSWFDKIILLFVKLTTGPASYPSDRDFKKLVENLFKIEKREVIRIKPYMPTIAVYSLRKVDK